jgi:Phage integrase family
LAFGWEIGCPQRKLATCGNPLMARLSKASATERSLPSYSAAVFDGESSPTSVSITFSGVRTVGRIVDLVGKGGHVRTVPIPAWVKQFLDEWFTAARITTGKLFRCVCGSGTVWGDGMTEKVVWHVVTLHAKKLEMPKLAPHDLRRSCARFCHAAGGELEQIQFLLGHVSVQTTERYLGCKQRFREAVNESCLNTQQKLSHTHDSSSRIRLRLRFAPISGPLPVTTSTRILLLSP